jgi:hypothetical protein
MDGRRQDFYLDQSFHFFFFFRLFGQVKFTLVAMNLTMACDLFIIHLIFTSSSALQMCQLASASRIGAIIIIIQGWIQGE